MACKHRFIKYFPTSRNLEFLIIGTFNPEWDPIDDTGAEYFYGRSTSQFWCICPHAFNAPCLIDKGIEDWILFCEEKKIGLIDIITEVVNADSTNIQDLNNLTYGYQDKNLELKVPGGYRYELKFSTRTVESLIDLNANTLKAVLFTRKSNQNVPRIWEEWQKIKSHCKSHNIFSHELPTPSPRGAGIRDKIEEWRKALDKANKRPQ